LPCYNAVDDDVLRDVTVEHSGPHSSRRSVRGEHCFRKPTGLPKLITVVVLIFSNLVVTLSIDTVSFAVSGPCIRYDSAT